MNYWLLGCSFMEVHTKKGQIKVLMGCMRATTCLQEETLIFVVVVVSEHVLLPS
eukprot:m.160469 g.160469  ORF g.160469 m.160469 type:complete len:54 (+) comp15168_c0_seq11:628-789(+)